MERLKTLEEYYRNFEYFLEVVILLDKYFSRLTNLTVLEDQETLKRFLMKIWSNTMIFLRSMMLNDDFKIGEKYGYYGRKICLFSCMDFRKTDNVKGAIFSAIF